MNNNKFEIKRGGGNTKMKTIKLPEDVVKKLEEVKTKEGYDSIEAIVFEALDVFVFFTKKEIRENLDLEYIG